MASDERSSEEAPERPDSPDAPAGIGPPAGPPHAPAAGPRAAGEEPSNPEFLRLLLVLLVAAIAAADRMLPAGIAASVLYVLPVWLGLWLRDRGTTRTLTILAAVLTGLDAWLSAGAVATEVLVANTVIALFALGIAARLGRYRHDVETALRESREAWATILESLEEGVLCTDGDERVAFLNSAAEEMIGVAAKDALGQPVRGVLRLEAPPSRRHADRMAGPSGERRVTIRELRRAGGGRLFVATSSAPLLDGQGRVVVLRDATDQRRYERAVERLAFRDTVTGLLNRVALSDRLKEEVERAAGEGTRLAVLFIDLDGFKTVNDTRGHHAGDLVLARVSRRLTAALRAADTVARVAGDEFCVLLPDLARREDAARVAAKLIAALEQPMFVDGGELTVGLSIGIALCPEDGTTAEGLLRLADQAMYRAKAAGGNAWRFHGSAPSVVPAVPSSP